MIICRIGISLSVSPEFEQVRLQAFEFGAKRFHISLHVFPGTISIVQQKTQRPAPIKRNQRLDDMVTIDNRFVIRSGELKHRSGPHLRWVIELAYSESRNSL